MSDEIGQEFDRVLRTALMGLGQLGERVARRQAEREREQATRLNQAQHEARQREQDARQRRQDTERAQERIGREQQRHLQTADRVWLDERDAARMVYRPFTQPATLERATPEQASKAWEQARFWSEQDPFARESARVIREAI